MRQVIDFQVASVLDCYSLGPSCPIGLCYFSMNPSQILMGFRRKSFSTRLRRLKPHRILIAITHDEVLLEIADKVLTFDTWKATGEAHRAARY